MSSIQVPSSLPRCRPLLWGAAALLAAFVSLPPSAAAEDAPRDTTFAGLWKLDVGKSDHAETMGGMRGPGGRGSWGGGARPTGGGMPGGMGGRPPGGPGDGPSERGPGRRPRGPESRLMMQPPDTLLIEQTDSTVVLIERGLPIEVLVIGLPQGKAGTVDPEAPHITASWSGKRLLALREDERGGRASQQFALSADGRSLTLILRREPRDAEMPPIELKREYRRDEGE